MLSIFTPKELEALEDDQGRLFIQDLKITPSELEKEVAKYPKVLCFYRIKYLLSKSSIPLYVYFQTKASGQGINQFAKTFDPTVVVPSLLSDIIGGVTSSISSLLYALAFSDKKEALKSTAKYAYSQPWRTQITDTYKDVLSSPCGACKNFANTVLLLSVNYTGAMGSIIFINADLKKLPDFLRWLIILYVLYCGNVFYSKYTNVNYYKGLKFWRDTSSPFLVQLAKKGQVALPFQIFLQGLSSVLLRTLIMYYLALASSNALGFWLPPPLIAALVVFHGYCILYPGTYRLYLEDHIALTAFLHLRDQYKSSVLEKKGAFFLFRESPLSSLSILIRAAAGAWLGLLGGKKITPDSSVLPILGSIGLGSLLGGLLYRAEAERVMNKCIVQIRKAEGQEQKQQDGAEETVKRTFCEAVSDQAALVVILANCVSSATSGTGLCVGLLGEDSPFDPMAMIGAIEAAVCLGIYNRARVYDTTRTVFVPKRLSSQASPSRNGHFAPKPLQPMLETKISIEHKLDERAQVTMSPKK